MKKILSVVAFLLLGSALFAQVPSQVTINNSFEVKKGASLVIQTY